MSDVATPGPAPVNAVAPTAGREERQARGQNPSATSQQGKDQAAPAEQKAPPPAVTVAASIAGVQPGERLAGAIIGVDGDGHPLLETPRGRFAIDPTAGLEVHMRAEIIITEAGPSLAAKVVARNGVAAEPPIAITLNLIALKGTRLASLDHPPLPPQMPLSTGYDGSAPRLAARPAPPVDSAALIAAVVKTARPPPTLQQGPDPRSPFATPDVSFLAATLGQADDAAAPVSRQPSLMAAFDIGAPLTAKVASGVESQAATPATPFEKLLAPRTGQTLSMTVVAVTPADDLSPVAAPTPGTPLARLAESGRAVTFIVQPGDGRFAPPATADAAKRPSLAPLRLSHGNTILTLHAASPLPPGTKVTALMLARGQSEEPAAAAIKAQDALPAAPGAPERAEKPGPAAAPGHSAARPARDEPTPTVAPAQALKPTPALATPPSPLMPEAAPLLPGLPPLPRLAPQGWPAAQSVLAILQASPEMAALARRIPQPGPQLTNGILFLWRALGLGSAEAWLGAEARERAMAQGGKEAWTVLQRDLAVLSEANRATQAEWRAWPLPVQTDAGLQLLSWFTRPLNDDRRRQGEADEEGREAPGQEFLLEVQLARFGRLRLRGTCRRRHLSLTVSSRAPLPDRLKASAGEAFRAALAVGALAGRLSFEVGLSHRDVPAP
ncbi:MAG: hypothetical protein ACOY99_03835 [Pseudomonadota bacterium]